MQLLLAVRFVGVKTSLNWYLLATKKVQCMQYTWGGSPQKLKAKSGQAWLISGLQPYRFHALTISRVQFGQTRGAKLKPLDVARHSSTQAFQLGMGQDYCTFQQYTSLNFQSFKSRKCIENGIYMRALYSRAIGDVWEGLVRQKNRQSDLSVPR